jgi:solute carrier family 25 (mitochondrial folate transporter), member 32
VPATKFCAWLLAAVQDGVRGALPLYRGVADAVGSIVRQEGWRSLYAGLTPALIGAGDRFQD